ncbi:hypothetical protein HYPSUDRAFT_191120 [Hypholoma sublateritium FD-334 SS-4]|uniref:FAD-binding domain-containing protein n=1 Tax=Hypholoma sublateritium (strain FD-334 SS-4) TaxID=945553 RepID=A0A0D2NND5_HYPSF|nr:hypothetical protein HYPSUDRAFT_191120 [Hypholoma sublateritium FD-334 SS-4]
MSFTDSTHLKHSKTDVLVVGAGPSGLMAAQALGRLGIDVTVIERRGIGEAYGNADGLVPRSMEIWQTYGMLDPFDAKGGARMVGLVTYETSPSDGRLVRSRPKSNVVVSSRYPYELTGATEFIEGTLRKNADDADVKFVQPAWPIAIDVRETDDEFPVKVSLLIFCVAKASKATLTNGTSKYGCYCTGEQSLEIISAKYVIGADGAYSWIRRTLNINMEGEQTEDVWGVVDVHLKTDFPDIRFKCVIQAASGPLIIIPREEDKIRIYIAMSTSDKIPLRDDGRVDKTAFDPKEMLQKILQHARERFSPFNVEFTEVFWSTIFATAQKVASTFSYRTKVFITGDACHTHSPKAGQGANASMGDAHNLAWKVAYAVRGWASPSLLNTYEEERRPYAQALISFDKEISKTLEENRPAEEYQKMLHKQNMFGSGIGINYASSVLTATTKSYGIVVPGERFPFAPIIRIADWRPYDAHDLLPSDGKFKLIILSGDVFDPKAKVALNDFAAAYHNAVHARGSEALDEFWGLPVRLSVYVVAHNAKEDILWTEIPTALAESWTSCFTTHGPIPGVPGGNLYEKFGMADSSSPGAAVLVRPDGHVSMITGLESENADKILSFIYNL